MSDSSKPVVVDGNDVDVGNIQPRGRGRPPHQPTKETRRLVAMGARGATPHHEIARALGIGIHTLRRDYKTELRTARIYAKMKMGARLYNAGMKGNVKAMIHWLSMRGGDEWKPRPVDHHLSGPAGGAIPIAAAAVAITDDDAAKTYMALVREEI